MSVIMYRSLATRSPLYGENWKLEHTFPRVEKIGRHPRTKLGHVLLYEGGRGGKKKRGRGGGEKGGEKGGGREGREI